MKKVAQKTFQITTEIRENPFNKAQHDQLGKQVSKLMPMLMMMMMMMLC